MKDMPPLKYDPSSQTVTLPLSLFVVLSRITNHVMTNPTSLSPEFSTKVARFWMGYSVVLDEPVADSVSLMDATITHLATFHNSVAPHSISPEARAKFDMPPL